MNFLKTLQSMVPAHAGLAGRLLAGAALAYSGTLKAAAPPEEFAIVIEAYGMLPLSMVPSVSALLPWAEALAGFALILGFLTRASAAAAAAMFLAFETALLYAQARGLDLGSCGCFGPEIHLTPGQASLLDLLLLAAAAAAFGAGDRLLSLDNWASAGYTPVKPAASK